MRLDENSFTTSRIGVRRSYRVHGPDARPKLVVKAPPQADGTGTQVHIANGPFRTSDFGFPSGFGFHLWLSPEFRHAPNLGLTVSSPRSTRQRSARRCAAARRRS